MTIRLTRLPLLSRRPRQSCSRQLPSRRPRPCASASRSSSAMARTTASSALALSDATRLCTRAAYATLSSTCAASHSGPSSLPTPLSSAPPPLPPLRRLRCRLARESGDAQRARARSLAKRSQRCTRASAVARPTLALLAVQRLTRVVSHASARDPQAAHTLVLRDPATLARVALAQ